jgi:hypothetical protein
VVALLTTLGLLVPGSPATADAKPGAERRGCRYWRFDPKKAEPGGFFLPTPDPDPFYAQPNPFPCEPPGTILDSREIIFTPMRGLAMPQHEASHLKFVSTDAHGSPIAAVATVVKPTSDAAAYPPRLLSFQIPENSLGTKCSTSHTLAGGTDNPGVEGHAPLYLPALTEEGWTLVLPDHLGPRSAYLEPLGAAHITLDAIRAAQRFLGLSTDTATALWGYSGASPASAWGGALQPRYAPELNLVGAAAGGTVIDPENASTTMDGGAFFMFAFAVSIGLERVHPGFFPAENLTADGVAAVEAMKDECQAQRSDGSPPVTGEFADYTNTNHLATPDVKDILARITLPRPGLTPTARSYFYHGAEDQIQSVEVIDVLVQAWCDEGVPVAYNRIPLAEHFAAAFGGHFDAMRFLKSAFAGDGFVPLSTTTACNWPEAPSARSASNL